MATLFSPHAEAIEFPKRGFSRSEAVVYLLNRAAYGPRPGEVEKLTPPGALEKWLDAQMNPGTIDDAEVLHKLKALKSVNESPDELLSDFPVDGRRLDLIHIFTIIQELVFQKYLLAAESKKELEQVLVDFWFNHFSVNGVYPQYLGAYERETIRNHVFGRFEDLLMASAADPQMLYFLDNWESRYQGINENYARELLELHTIGVDGGYTQQDVENTAQIFTGWTIVDNQTKPRFKFEQTWHNPFDVIVLGHRYSGKQGVKQGQALLQFLAAQPQTARFLAQKLCRHFVSDPASKACVDRVSRRYLETSGDLKKVYLTLFTSPEFWQRSNVGQRMKKPFEYDVSALRMLGSNISPDSISVQAFTELSRASGEALYGNSSPSGYSDQNESWTATDTLLAHLQTAPSLIDIAHGTWKPSPATLHSDLEQFLSKTASAKTYSSVLQALGNNTNLAFSRLLCSSEFQWR